ncbi:winged helix-turn-helix transcriptional regulator [Virgisporangium ochraceum]|uniref:winged helix-turn-helix transcriptional regulator n=1 Tax=Virgisporangium ochraceum TaxID=65505 RepID=UPI001EF33DE6|nr:helix-turn-helix domain-containing protein [Virgisporangium ochraceum]
MPSVVVGPLPVPVPSAEYDACPVTELFRRFGDKWTLLIVVLLGQRPHRFNELHRTVEGISQRMLTRTVRILERDGLIARTVHATAPPSVEYDLTPLGRTLLHPLSTLADWAVAHGAEIASARNRHDAHPPSPGSSMTGDVGGPPVELDEAVEFYAAYLDALYRYEVAVRTEPDDVLAERRARAHTFLDPLRGAWIDTWSPRPPGLTPEEIGQWEARLPTMRRPALFLVAEYAVPEWGSLFAGYTGGTGTLTYRSYMYRFLAGEVDGKPAIVSQYSIEPSYGEEGQVTWDFTQGVEVADLGRPVAARGLREPFLDDEILDYRRILQETGA